MIAHADKNRSLGLTRLWEVAIRRILILYDSAAETGNESPYYEPLDVECVSLIIDIVSDLTELFQSIHRRSRSRDDFTVKREKRLRSIMSFRHAPQSPSQALAQEHADKSVDKSVDHAPGDDIPVGVK